MQFVPAREIRDADRRCPHGAHPGVLHLHVFKTGRPYWWAFVILGFPVLCCIIRHEEEQEWVTAARRMLD